MSVLAIGTCPARAEPAAPGGAATKPAGRPLPPEYYQGRTQSNQLKLTAGSGGGMGNLLARLMGYTVLILVMGAATLLVVRKLLPRLSGGASGRNIAILETVYLGPRKSLHLLRVGSKRFLVAGSKEQLSMLGEVTDAFDEAAGEGDGADMAETTGSSSPVRRSGLFASLLKRTASDEEKAFAPEGMEGGVGQGRSKNEMG